MPRQSLGNGLTKFEDRVIRETQLRVRTMQPAKVLAYDDATSTATVELAHLQVERDEDGSELVREPLVIPNVMVPQWGSDEAYVRIPLVPGCTGLVVISDRSLAGWRTDGEAHDPPLPSLHNLADAIFVPGLRPDSNPLPPATLGGMQLEAAAIQLGVGATEAAVLGNILDTLWGQMVTFMTTHVHPTAAPGPPSVATPIPGLPPPSIASALSTKVRIGS